MLFQDTALCFEEGVQWKLHKPFFCTEFAESKNKELKKPVKGTLKS